MNSIMYVRLFLFGLVALSMLQSFLAISDERTSTHNHWIRLSNLEQQFQLQNKQGHDDTVLSSDAEKGSKALAQVYWQENKLAQAEPLLRKLWLKNSVRPGNAYTFSFVDSALDLAGLYLDEGAFPAAITCYESILNYDTQHLGRYSTAVRRDLNNLSVTYYLISLSTANNLQRKNYLQHSLQYAEQAEDIARLLKEPSTYRHKLPGLTDKALITRDWDECGTLKVQPNLSSYLSNALSP